MDFVEDDARQWSKHESEFFPNGLWLWGCWYKLVEWMSYCCFMMMPKFSHFFSFFMTKTSYIQWNDGDVHFVLDQHTVSWIFIVLAHWKNNIQVNISLNSDTLFCLCSCSLFNATCLAEKQQIKLYLGGVQANDQPHSSSRLAC